MGGGRLGGEGEGIGMYKYCHGDTKDSLGTITNNVKVCRASDGHVSY